MKYLFLLSGKMRSGKNQFADYVKDICAKRNYTTSETLYAKILKDRSVEDFKVLYDIINNKIETATAHLKVFNDNHQSMIPQNVNDEVLGILDGMITHKHNFYEEKTDLSRAMLQIYGTEIMRNRVNDNYWVEKTCDVINADKETDIIIITDARFENEIYVQKYIKDRRVIPIRINRDMDRTDVKHEHISETALDDFCCFEYILDNNGSLDDLRNMASDIIDELPNIAIL